MKFLVRPSGETKKGAYHRFDVVLAEDDGTELMVIRAWRVANFKQIIPPQSYGKGGMVFNVIAMPNAEFTERLLKAVVNKIDPNHQLRTNAQEDAEVDLG